MKYLEARLRDMVEEKLLIGARNQHWQVDSGRDYGIEQLSSCALRLPTTIVSYLEAARFLL